MARTWLLLIIVAALTVGCGQQAERAEAPGEAPGEAPAAPEPGGGGFAAGGGAGGLTGDEVLPRPAGAIPPDLPRVQAQVIKTADLEVKVESGGFRDAMDRAVQVASRHGGFVVTSVVRGSDARRGSLTLRIPADGFEDALSELRALGTVQRERIKGEDVSQEFVDLEARLRNLQAQEAVLLRLFDEAVSVADTIRVQQELSGVQLQIEEIQGRLRYLRDQTALSTITVSLVEEGAGAPGAFSRAWNSAIDGFLGVLTGLVVVLGYAIPLALLALLAFLGYRWARNRWLEPEASSPSAPEGPPRRRAPRTARRS